MGGGQDAKLAGEEQQQPEDPLALGVPTRANGEMRDDTGRTWKGARNI
jgi:hypothetical protein